MTLILATARVEAQCTDDFILISTTDFSTGSTSSLDPVNKTPTIDLEPVGSDAVVRTFGGLVYVVNRGGTGNIQILDPCDDFNTIDQWSTGNGSNPHDIVVLSPTVAYVSRYDMTSVLKMNPQTGATITTIDLSIFADADGLPEMDQMWETNNQLFVALQRLDRNNFYTPVGTSYIAVIDLATDTLVDMNPGMGGVQPVTLVHTNPYSEVHFWTDTSIPGPAYVYFSAVGYFGVLDGGVLFDVAESPTSQTVILSEAEAGGDILDVEILTDDKGFAIVATPSFVTELIAFNPTTRTKTATMYSPGGYDLNDCEPSPLGLLLTDRKPSNPGIRCFSMYTNVQYPGGPIDVGLPPFDILVSVDWPTPVGDSPRATALGANYPNPFNPETSIPFSLASAGRVSLKIYDVSGRSVAQTIDHKPPPCEHVARWDGRDARGRASSSGVYFARLEANGTTETKKIALIK